MRNKLVFSIVLGLVLFIGLSHAAQASGNLAGRTPPAWSDPQILYPEAWPGAWFFDMDDTATTLVALVPNSGSSDTTRQVVVTAKSGNTWQTPQVVAENGAYSNAQFQVLPQVTHPVISGDGSTIAYVGYTGSTYGAYVIDRVPGGWSAPTLVNTGLPNTHYWISLSADGNTLALCDYPFFDIQKVYVVTRQGGVWGAPVEIGWGGNPSLSADGTRLAYVGNTHVAFSQKVNGVWSAPITLTNNDQYYSMVEFPQLSKDGQSIFYWLVTLTPQNRYLVRTAQNLYMLRAAPNGRTGTGWSQPQQVNAAPVLPAGGTDGPAAADRRAVRLVYTEAVTTSMGTQDVVTGSRLHLSEYIDDHWQDTILVEINLFGNYNWWPRLSADGKTLVFDASGRAIPGGVVTKALWGLTTSTPPPLPPTTTAVIPPSGGQICSLIDQVCYDISPNTFTDTVQITHMHLAGHPAPPPNMTDIDRLFSLTAIFTGSGLPAQPTLPITVTIGYGAGRGLPIIAGTLCLWRLDDSAWTRLDCTDDPAQQLLTAQVVHFSTFGVFGETRRVFLPIIRR